MISIRQAGPADNDGLLELTSMTPMDGKISIRIDRKPDFFRLLHLRGPGIVFVAEKDHRIIGSISSAAVKTRLDGKKEMVHYIGDLKVHPEFMGSRVALKLATELYSHLKSSGADFLFCTAAWGNQKVLPFFDGRAGLPKFENLGHFNVYQLVPSRKRKPQTHFTIMECSDVELIRKNYSAYWKKYLLMPEPSAKYLEACTHFTASRNEELCAAISLYDPFDAKQNVLLKLPFFLNLLVYSIRTVNRIISLMHLPSKNQPIRILYSAYFCYLKDNEKALLKLIDMSLVHAFENGYTFLCMGFHSKDPINKLLRNYRKFLFRSVGLITSLNNRTEVVNKIKNGLIFEDYSLI